MERMNRRWNSLSAEHVQKLFDETPPEQYSHGGLEGPYKPAYSDALCGRTYTLKSAEHEVTLHFDDINTVTWSEDGQSGTDFCAVHEAEADLFFIHYAMKHTSPPRFNTIVMDFKTGSFTLICAVIGNGTEAREVCRTFHFGRITGCENDAYPLHGFTADLVGKAIYWTYNDRMPPLKHIYSSELYYSYAMTIGERCWMASNPCDFVKINDHEYIFTFLEERQTGVQGVFLINTETMHDVGCFSGIPSDDKFESYTVGAIGEWTTMDTHFIQK